MLIYKNKKIIYQKYQILNSAKLRFIGNNDGKKNNQCVFILDNVFLTLFVLLSNVSEANILSYN